MDKDKNIHSLFYPRGVAVVGSTSKGKLGYELLRQILEGGFREVYAVNPRGQGLILSHAGEEMAVPGYEAVSRIERPVDLAVIASPAPTVPGVLEDFDLPDCYRLLRARKRLRIVRPWDAQMRPGRQGPSATPT